MANLQDLLVLKYQNFRGEVSRFFVELNNSPALRRQFFKNPTLSLQTKIPSLRDIKLSNQQEDLANRILFSALSNEEFLNFLRTYREKKIEAITRYLNSPDDKQAANELDERTIKAEFAAALLEFGDKELLSIILDSCVNFQSAQRVIYYFVHQTVTIFEHTLIFTDHVTVISDVVFV